jgi:hypothetical protein
MCCFAFAPGPFGRLARWMLPPVKVDDTQIFGRRDGPRQVLVYSMKLSARAQVAMILPLPVRWGCGEDEVEFVSLERCSDFFDWIDRPFRHIAASRAAGPFALPRLRVHTVGLFEASFVPSVADFSRLDPRFRLPDRVWEGLPLYRDYGFAVFKLRPGARQRIHPMALRFPTRDPGRLFFPTVHVHDGRVRSRARFDHALYFQRESDRAMRANIALMRAREARERPVEISGAPAEHLGFYTTSGPVKMSDRTAGLVKDDWHLFKTTLRGQLANEDTWIADQTLDGSTSFQSSFS